ncbi:MAG: amidase [Acidimicrobiaceae bacterium]|nr:amidase [Acidimicrobiaceae bacterium]
MSDSRYWSATECVAALCRGDVSSVELIDEAIARIETLNPRFNIVVATDFERARRKAAAADAVLAAGESVGPLHGVPITIKDSFETAGLITTSGSPKLRHHVPDTNALAVERLTEAGAIILGKTNLPLFASDFQSYNDVYGLTRNPWDPDRTAGGSSGGAAAALAAGLVPLELGSDIGGSIRIPAHFCGVYGHKPSYGIVPLDGHLLGPPGTLQNPDLIVAGPMARSPQDLSLALQVMAGAEESSSTSQDLALSARRRRDLNNLRVGYWFDDPRSPLEIAVRTELEAAVDALRSATNVVEIDIPFTLDEILKIYAPFLVSVFSEKLSAPLRQLARSASPALRLRWSFDPVRSGTLAGIGLTPKSKRDLDERQTKLRRACRRLFNEIDVLLTPVVAFAAPHHNTRGNLYTRSLRVDGKRRHHTDHFSWIALATMAYLPATSAPVGVTPEGLPVNVQIIGDYLDDHTTIQFAELLAAIRGGFQPPPLL